MSETSWGPIDPNSDHQIWSRWRFEVHGKTIPLAEIELNFARWIRLLFRTTVGQALVQERVTNEGGLPTRALTWRSVSRRGGPAAL